MVQGGTFTVLLGSVAPLSKEVLDGGPRWLAVGVRGPGEAAFTALTPRQELNAAAALAAASPASGAACPHDHLSEYWLGSSTTSDGLRVENTKPQGNGLVGVASNGTLAWGVLGNSESGIGVRGNSSSGTGVWGQASGGDGVHGESTTGDGVSGTAAAANNSGVFGLNSDGGYGVVGRSVGGFGMEAAGGGDDSGTDAVGDLVLGGERAEIFHVGSWYMNLYSNGDFIVDLDNDDNSANVFRVLSGTDGDALQVDEDGNLFTAGSKAGDVVVISGAGPAVMGEIPVIRVRLATSGAASGVVGVVDKHYVPASARAAESADRKSVSASVDEAAIAPGEYLTVVTLGSFKAVKVDASFGAIKPGDLLVASPNPGYAMRATDPQPGTIIGKALDALPSGSGVIAVIVTLQ